MSRLRPIIAFLAFALLIQNTCPFDLAGKSTVATPCEHCPLEHEAGVSADGLHHIVSDSAPVHFPLYVFSLPKTMHTFRLELIRIINPVLPDTYKDAVPSELLRPPRV